MKIKQLIILVSVILLIIVAIAAPVQPTSGAPEDIFQFIDLEKSYSQGFISNDDGLSEIWVVDQDADGVDELVSCGSGSIFILEYQAGRYLQQWFSPYIDCIMIAVGDLNGDEKMELVTLTTVHYLLVFDGGTYEEIARIPTPDRDTYQFVTDFLIANVDSDPQNEIVFTSLENTYVYNGQTYQPEWVAYGQGGEQVEVANVDDDPTNEIIVNDTPAHVLDATLQTEEWFHGGGFGKKFAVGDVDGDGKTEIAALIAADYPLTNLRIFDTDPFVLKWATDSYTYVEDMALLDTDRDGVDEVVLGQRDAIRRYAGLDGSVVWSIPITEHEIFGLAAGDLNQDDINEVYWRTSWGSADPDGVYMGNWSTQSIEWQTTDPSGPITLEVADVDLDGQNEIITASKGIIEVFNLTTRAPEWFHAAIPVDFLAVGQVDTDPGLEIIVSSASWTSRKLQVFDGVSHELEWESSTLPSSVVSRIWVNEIDDDGIDEIFVPLDDGSVNVYDGSSSLIQWRLSGLGEVQDIAIGDPNENSLLDLAILTSDNLQVYEIQSRTPILNREYRGGEKLAVTNAAAGLSSSYLIVNSSTGITSIKSFSGSSFAPQWERSLPYEGVTYFASDFQVADLNNDGIDEFILSGGYDFPNELPTHSPLLLVGSITAPQISDYRYLEPGFWISDVAVADVDADQQVELLFGTQSYWQVNEFHFEERHFLYTPALFNQACYQYELEDFSDPTSGWPNFDSDDLKVGYVNGEYQVLLKDSPVWTGYRLDPQYYDFVASIEVRNPDATPGWYGLYFGVSADWSLYYVLEISAAGEYAIWKKTGTQRVIIESGSSNVIHQGSARNTLKIVRNGSQFQVYVNDALLSVLEDARFSGPLHLGYSIKTEWSPNLEIFYDNYEVRYNVCQLNSLLPEHSSADPAAPGSFFAPPIDR